MRARGLLPAMLLLVACGSETVLRETSSDSSPESSIASPPLLADITEASGIDFVHWNGASLRRYLPETMGSGAAFFDANGDDLPDLYLVNGCSIAESEERPPSGALYLNRGAGTFQNVTRVAGLDKPFCGMGAAVGDVDNDGDLDLFVTGVGGDHLYLNRGAGTFEEAVDTGLDAAGFGSSAAFLDFDRDGLLDLYAGRYVAWSPESDARCSPDGDHFVYCTPEVYSGSSNRLYHNLGDGRFEDVTRAAGVERAGKTLGVVAFDHDRDGWPDLAVANDTARNFLFVNHWDGTFRELGVESGIAHGPSGATRGAMGIDVGDLDGSGEVDLVLGNFSQEMSAVYRNIAPGLYADEAAQLGIGLPTLMMLGFGTLVIDLDLDGWLDVVFANGHIEPEIARFQRSVTYAQPLQVFRNRGGDRGFERLEDERGPLGETWVGRGLAAADIDGDGDLDLILTQNGRPARLLRNDTPSRPWLRLKLVGSRSPRTPYGATVVAVAGERRLVRMLASGRSYLSASEPILTFGLGELGRLDRLEITWPSGMTQTVAEPPLGQLLTVEEPDSEGG